MTASWDHALVIGGTGMLRRATVAIAQRSRKLTAIARTEASLDALASLLSDRDDDRYKTLDWNEPEQFLWDLQLLVEEVGPPTLVLAWLHDVNLGPRVAVAVSIPESSSDFFQVIGSSGGNPYSGATNLRSQVKALRYVNYFQVVLGFKRDARARRWLTNDEISDGVLEAIRRREACHTVGTVTPSARRTMKLS